MNNKNNITQYSAADIEKYWDGKMSAAEMRDIEKAALDDPFLADALDGYKNTTSIKSDLDILEKRLAEKTAAGTAPVINIFLRTNWWKIAAGIAGLAGIGYLAVSLFMSSNNNSSIASSENNKLLTGSQTDTINEYRNTTEPDEIRDSSAEINNNRESRSSETIVSWGKAGVKPDSQSVAVISDFGELSAVNKFEVNDNTKINEPLSSIELNKEKSIQNALSDTLAFKQQPTASAPKTNENDKFFEQGTVNSKRLENKAKSKPIFYPGLINDTYGNSIPYATIINLSNQVSVSSSLTGYFNIPVEEDSLVLLDVSAPGFTPREFRLNRFTKNNTLTLYEVPAEEEEGIITVSAELYDPLYSNLKITDLPEPENGWLLFNEYLRNKLTEKKETLKRGTVILEFNINNINRPSMIKVIKSLTPECNEEAIRLLKDGPRWKIKGKTKDINLMFRFY